MDLRGIFIPDILPFLAVMLPITSTIVRPFVERHRHHHFTTIVTFATFILIILMYPSIIGGKILKLDINTGIGFNLSFMVDKAGFMVGLISAVLWLVAGLYGIEYLKDIHGHNRYNVFSLLSFGGMLGVVFTGNLFTLYIFFELLSVGSAVLVFHEETPDAMKAGFKYLFLGIAGGLILLFAIIGTYEVTKTLDFCEKVGIGLKGSPWLPYIFWGYIIGFGVKAGIFPLHVWLPSAHPVAPSPASALLSGVMIKAGAYGIFRTIYNIIGMEDITSNHMYMILSLLILALITIFIGSAVAITQTEIKKMLAYSSISQIGYIIMGLALLSPLGVVGGFVHIFSHALTKGALFLCAGAIIYKTGLRKITDLRGIGHRMPVTTAVFTIGALSMIGLPPFMGFISKWFLALGSLELINIGAYWSGIGIISLSVLLLSSLLNLIYYGPIIIRAWFVEGSTSEEGNNEKRENSQRRDDDPNLVMVVPMLTLAFFLLLWGIFPRFPVALARGVSRVFFG